MWCTIVKLYRNNLLCYEARVYCGTERRYTYAAMSEAGVRTWLAEQGVPFNRQPRFPAVVRA